MSRRPFLSFHPAGRQGGAVAIVVAISLAVLIGSVGLALDLGKLFVAKTELQNGADACALAASRELTGTNNNQLVIAEAAGMTAGTRNRVLFQSEPINVQEDISVTFSEEFAGAYQPKGAFTGADVLRVRYARCTVERTDIANWLIEILNILPGVEITDQRVQSTAVAGLRPAQTNCAIPVTICNNTPAYASAVRGTWLESVVGPQNSITGSFLWVDLSPPQGGGQELAQLLRGPGACSLPAEGAEIGQSGAISSLGNDWNSRFGVYQGGIRPEDAVPDFSGYAYTMQSWPSGFGAYTDFVGRRTSNAPYQGNAATGLNVRGTIQNSAFLRSSGSDRRLVIVPVVNCSEFGGGSQYAAIRSWACVLMLHPINNSQGGGGGSPRMYLEYLGAANDPASPCATLGLPGSADSVGPQVPVLVQ